MFSTSTPEIVQGQVRATGVSVPRRPTWTSIFEIRVQTPSTFGGFTAMAQRGEVALAPMASCVARSLTFTTTPSAGISDMDPSLR